ncbi:MAG: hypothetical protein RMK29_10440 [Myxococcales bacterium]|nr:hypothetical protein [Myxococcota bacterium]MDW8282121.1 hypothetical protein [Myxococcales bacterium]
MKIVDVGAGGQDSGLCLMLQGLLEEGVQRHGGSLRVLGARVGIDAPDAAAQATLVLGHGRCLIEAGLREPDLVLQLPSEVLAQLREVPLRLGLPWMLSRPGWRLLWRVLLGEVRLRQMAAPLRAGRAAVDLLLLFRLLAGA